MGYTQLRSAVLWALLLPPLAVIGQPTDKPEPEPQPIESDWLELVKGYRGDTVGAEMREIEDGDTKDTQKITLAIPKSAITHPDAIEEVVVYGRKPEDPEPLDITYEWLDDYDGDNYGLVIRLGRNSNWPIRLYMYSNTGFTR